MLFFSVIMVLALAVSVGVEDTALSTQRRYVVEHAQEIESSYLTLLDHDFESVVESSIYNIIDAKHQYPELDMSRIKVKLQDLSTSGRCRSICRKAEIAYAYLSDPNGYRLPGDMDPCEPERLFSALANQIVEKAITWNQ